MRVLVRERTSETVRERGMETVRQTVKETVVETVRETPVHLDLWYTWSTCWSSPLSCFLVRCSFLVSKSALINLAKVTILSLTHSTHSLTVPTHDQLTMLTHNRFGPASGSTHLQVGTVDNVVAELEPENIVSKDSGVELLPGLAILPGAGRECI